MKIALVQLSSSDDPDANLPQTLTFVQEAAASGADLILTPEVTNCVSLSRSHQKSVLKTQEKDQTLRALCDAAKAHDVAINIGSLALTSDNSDPRFLNRSFFIDNTGKILTTYDKIHMFDVSVSPTETFRESDGYQPGDQLKMVTLKGATFGLSICYDLRFPHIYRALAQAGAEVLLVPSAFAPTTGRAHWETLLRARAIETGSYVFAAAQTGTHPSKGKPRTTYGHSLAVGPWGDLLCDAGTAPGVSIVEIDLSEVSKARSKIPSLQHDREFKGPE